MSLRQGLSSFLGRIQEQLFPVLKEEYGPLPASHKKIVLVSEMLRIEQYLPHYSGLPGRPMAERSALFRAFIAKSVMNLPTTRLLINQVRSDPMLRHLCGWRKVRDVPSEATFSRAFGEFARYKIPSGLHESLIKDTLSDHLVGHISRDSTSIEGHEKPVTTGKTDKPQTLSTPLFGPTERYEKPITDDRQADKPKRRRGRPRKGETVKEPEPRRVEVQFAGQSLEAMLADLPDQCSVGVKKNGKGVQEVCIGFKLHIDTADGDIPISCILTGASVHDSQVAIPLALTTAARVKNCYDLMDSAYDSPEIWDHSCSLGHIPIIDINTRRNYALKQEMAQEDYRQKLTGHPTPDSVRYNQRSSAERVNSNLKGNHGGATVRVRGPAKVMCHLMFGILVIAAGQILRLIQ